MTNQVNISYLSMTEEGGERRSVRQMELWRGYGFHCNCQACTLVASEFDNEEELRENLKQLQMVGAKNWDEIDASEYLEGISRLQGNMKHIMDVLAICFHASKDQVVYLRENIRYRPPPGTQTGIWGEMPYTGPLHLWPCITGGEQKSATLCDHVPMLRRKIGGRGWRCCNFGGNAAFSIIFKQPITFPWHCKKNISYFVVNNIH